MPRTRPVAGAALRVVTDRGGCAGSRVPACFDAGSHRSRTGIGVPHLPGRITPPADPRDDMRAGGIRNRPAPRSRSTCPPRGSGRHRLTNCRPDFRPGLAPSASIPPITSGIAVVFSDRANSGGRKWRLPGTAFRERIPHAGPAQHSAATRRETGTAPCLPGTTRSSARNGEGRGRVDRAAGSKGCRSNPGDRAIGPGRGEGGRRTGTRLLRRRSGRERQDSPGGEGLCRAAVRRPGRPYNSAVSSRASASSAVPAGAAALGGSPRR